MMRIPSPILLLLLGLLACGCKTKEVTKPDPDTEKALTDCKTKLDDKDKYIAKLLDENTRLQMQKGGGEIVVKIEGANMTISPGQPGGDVKVDPKVAEAGAKEFLGVIEKSKGNIKNCYEIALKKSSGLQSQEIALTVQASFTPQGSFVGASSAPSLGKQFDECLNNVARSWTVKASPTPMTYRQTVQLKPS